MKVSVLAVVVIYGIAPESSQTIATLHRAFTEVSSEELALKVLVVDNGPEPHSPPNIFPGEVYRSFPQNAGLAEAYNLGLQIAQSERFDWLLTLDQDTSLPADFLADLLRVADRLHGDPRIAAIVPQMTSAGQIISPYRYSPTGMPRWFRAGYCGLPETAVYALNSASLLRVKALLQCGGYDPRFWLDASDHMIFHALAAYGKRIYVAGDVQVEHGLSVLGDTRKISPERYSNMLAAESAFWDLKMSRIAGWVRNAMILRRGVRQFVRGDSVKARLSLGHLARRIALPRGRRLRAWEAKLARRSAVPLPTHDGRLSVSVCMAAYNNAPYIEEQIRSVLGQLGADDELIVVDDASKDATLEVVRAMEDPRIVLIRQERNCGVIATFERAVRSATGDVLFLCDGDDIWAPTKVEDVLDAFRQRPMVNVVTTGLRLIDGHGDEISSDAYLQGRDFTNALLPNLVRNRFQGSTMAIRSSLLGDVLPFPRGKVFLHDAWIGTCNIVMGGDAVQVPKPLLLYRRHGANVSRPLSSRGRVLARAQLSAALLSRWLSRMLNRV